MGTERVSCTTQSMLHYFEMEPKLTNLEEKVLGRTTLDLASAAFVASGVRNQRELDSYVAKVESLCQQIEADLAAGRGAQRAEALFDWLWLTKPSRYDRGGNFRLTDVIDAQLHAGTEKVGNCLGLTTLYNVLAQRLGVDTKAISIEDAFGERPHVFSILHLGQRTVDIETILPHGFDYKGHLASPHRVEWENTDLVADIYHSIGNQLLEQGQLEAAIRSYGKALWLNPEYSRAHLNRGIALSMLGRNEDARQDFSRTN